jgi:hypothetical protein
MGYPVCHKVLAMLDDQHYLNDASIAMPLRSEQECIPWQ